MVDRVTREEPSPVEHRDHGVESDLRPATKADVGHVLHRLGGIEEGQRALVGVVEKLVNDRAPAPAPATAPTDKRVEALEHVVDLALKVDTLSRGEPHKRRLAWVAAIAAAVSAAVTALEKLFNKHP